MESKIEVELFVTEKCTQCVIAIKRIKEITVEIEAINLNIVNVSNLNNGKNNFKKLAVTPYYLINEKFVVPGTSSKVYIESVIQSAITSA